MIGKITTGKSFYHCISYCLEDKLNLSEQQKQELSMLDNLQHKERAEVLIYNNCFGSSRELANQFNEVRKLSSRVEKPVLHISLRLAPGETLTKVQLAEIGRACAEEFKFDKSQYLCILHKDTHEQHIHIVANRVGYDGKAISLSNNYQQVANFCRKMEIAYNLRQVLNPKAFLPKDQRQIPRHDARKVELKNDIRQCLKKSLTYHEFEQKMKDLGYRVLKGRGIAFVDKKDVKTKGSEVGFSLMKIEKILANNLQTQKLKEELKQMYSDGNSQNRMLSSTQKLKKIIELERTLDDLEKRSNNLLHEMLKPQLETNHIPLELLKKRKRKKELRPKF